MDSDLYALHLTVGRICGRERTCGKKVGYLTLECAQKAASKISLKPNIRNPLEHYPCVFCGGWHIGRKMSPEELMHHISNALSIDIAPGWAVEGSIEQGEVNETPHSREE